MADAHDGGWWHYPDRLGRPATGADPGPDPFATIRVPNPGPVGDAGVTTDEDRLEELAVPLLATGRVTRSTMMGLPCLRHDGAFLAAVDRRTGAPLVKLPRARVEPLIDTGSAEPFAPAGRQFREWAAVPTQQTAIWPALLDEALLIADERIERRPNPPR